MILHALREAPDARLAESLAAFETQFIYPLGPGHCFRISHGDDYRALSRRSVKRPVSSPNRMASCWERSALRCAGWRRPTAMNVRRYTWAI